MAQRRPASAVELLVQCHELVVAAAPCVRHVEDGIAPLVAVSGVESLVVGCSVDGGSTVAANGRPAPPELGGGGGTTTGGGGGGTAASFSIASRDSLFKTGV